MDFSPDKPDTSLDQTTRPTGGQNALIDRYGRRVSYLRVSVTDRCDLRCSYCMSENMRFLPKREILSFEEILVIVSAFVARGVDRVRLTGGEPLVRRDIMKLVAELGQKIRPGALSELTLTTNGTQLQRFAGPLFERGVRRVNVSLDTRDADKFATIARRNALQSVENGIEAARKAGLAVKINMVVMRGVNDGEVEDMIAWAHGEGMDLTLIEGMPLGEVALNRAETHLPLREIRDRLAEKLTLETIAHKTGGPARYYRVAETGGRLGFIAPLTHNFCESCNRVRMTATGQLYLCLGQEDQIDLRQTLREDGPEGLDAALDRAMIIKPKGHDFVIDRNDQTPSLSRHMSVTGG